jgi:hypothetical protein
VRCPGPSWRGLAEALKGAAEYRLDRVEEPGLKQVCQPRAECRVLLLSSRGQSGPRCDQRGRPAHPAAGAGRRSPSRIVGADGQFSRSLRSAHSGYRDPRCHAWLIG